MQLGLRRRHVHTQLEPSHQVKHRIVPVRPGVRPARRAPGQFGHRQVTPQRHPKVGTDERDAGEALRGDPDDLAADAIGAHELADELRIATPPPPEAIAQNHDRGAALPLFLRQKTPSTRWSDPQKGKVIRRDVRRPHLLDQVRMNQGDGSWVIPLGHEITEGQTTVADGDIRGMWKPGEGGVLDRAVRQLLGILHLPRAQEQQIGHAEHDCVGTNADGQGKQGNRREPRRLSQHANTVAQILPQNCHRMTPSAYWNTRMTEY